MFTVNGRNVNDVYMEGMTLLSNVGEESESRAGDVLVAPCPVTSIYQRPCERVLIDERRDANPFFHLFESLWMIQGRRDAAFLNQFVRDFGDRFAEEDGNLHGAYGWRWRNHFWGDQLEEVIRKLRANPLDRQVVIQMWDPNVDLGGGKRDIPCNTQLYLRIRNTQPGTLHVEPPVLDLTIMCRSNDIVWGAYGANAVHFSMLQEYLAGCIGVGVGTMYQISNNFHAYKSVFERVWPAETVSWMMYETGAVHALPIGSDWEHWDDDLDSFLQAPLSLRQGYKNTWFSNVAWPMFQAHNLHKEGKHASAVAVAREVEAEDWRLAALQWLERRHAKYRTSGRVEEVRQS